MRIWIFKWRASLVPAAAVIPAPLAYTIIVAVKRLVVGLNKLICSTHTHWELTYIQHCEQIRMYQICRIPLRALYAPSWNVAQRTPYTHIDTAYMSMGIVGINSTTGRAVKCIDPSKTTKSESSWLGYTLCAAPNVYTRIHTHIYTLIYAYTSSARHFTMKNEGWGIKEDQIPSSSH